MIPMGVRVRVTVVREVALKRFVVFADTIYARGWQASLAEFLESCEIHRVVGVAHALAHRGLGAADTVLLECERAGGTDFAEELGELSAARVLLCTRGTFSEQPASAARTEVGVLAAGTLTPKVVTAAVRAVGTSVGVPGINLLRDLCREGPCPAAANGVLRVEHLRELQAPGAVPRGRRNSHRDIAQRHACSRLDREERSARRADQARRSDRLACGGDRRARGDHVSVSDRRDRPMRRTHWSVP
jgi:hypothetical protein